MDRFLVLGGSISCRMASKTTRLYIILFLQAIQLAGQVFVGGGNHLPKADKGPHDENVDGDRPTAIEDAGKHRDTLLGEGVGQVFPVPSAPRL